MKLIGNKDKGYSTVSSIKKKTDVTTETSDTNDTSEKVKPKSTTKSKKLD